MVFKYFHRGGFLFGAVYTMRQSWALANRAISTWIHRHALGKCGRGSVFYPGVYVGQPQKMQVGDDCLILQNAEIGSELDDGHCRLGDRVQINDACRIDCSGGLDVGSDTLISRNVAILTHSHGYDPKSSPDPCPLTIEPRVWIGAGAMIMHSVRHIGADSIVAAGSVVTRDVPANAIVGGNPARVIKMRDDVEWIDRATSIRPS